jgi:hypothetical protein
MSVSNCVSCRHSEWVPAPSPDASFEDRKCAACGEIQRRLVGSWAAVMTLEEERAAFASLGLPAFAGVGA